jgi:hypothetical protein
MPISQQDEAEFQKRLSDMHPDIRLAFEQNAADKLEVAQNQRRGAQLQQMTEGEQEQFRQAAFRESILHVTPFPERETQDALVRRAEMNEATGPSKREHRAYTLHSMVTSGIGMAGPNFAEAALKDEQEAARWQAEQFMKQGKQTGNVAVDKLLGEQMPETKKRRALMEVIVADTGLRTQAMKGFEKKGEAPAHAERTEARQETATGMFLFS